MRFTAQDNVNMNGKRSGECAMWGCQRVPTIWVSYTHSSIDGTKESKVCRQCWVHGSVNSRLTILKHRPLKEIKDAV